MIDIPDRETPGISGTVPPRRDCGGTFKKSFFQIFRAATIGLLLVLVCSSCTFLNKRMTRDRDKEVYVHQVKWEGETLSILAKWYTGNLDNWKAIAKANPNLDPNRIVIGKEIRIPAALLITRNPMPKSFLAGFGVEKKARPPMPETSGRPEPASVPAPATRTQPPAEPEKRSEQPDKGRPTEAPDQAAPQAEPAIELAPARTGDAPVLPQKRALPITATPPEIETKQTPSQTGRPAQPKVEKKPAQPKAETPPQKDEPPLFGPKGYSN